MLLGECRQDGQNESKAILTGRDLKKKLKIKRKEERKGGGRQKKTYSSNRTHGVVNATWSQTTLDNLKASSLAENHCAHRNSHVGKGQVSVAMGCVIVSVDLEHALDFDARRVDRHQQHRLLLIRILVVLIRLSHDNVDLATRITGSARPPLLPIEHVFVAVASNVQLNIGRIRRSHLRLRHEESRSNLALHQRFQPLLLLGIVAILGQHLHVARVGSRAVTRLGRAARPTKPFGHDAILEIRPARRFPVVALGQEHVPETQLLGLVLELFHHRRVCFPAGIPLADLGLQDRISSMESMISLRPFRSYFHGFMCCCCCFFRWCFFFFFLLFSCFRKEQRTKKDAKQKGPNRTVCILLPQIWPPHQSYVWPPRSPNVISREKLRTI